MTNAWIPPLLHAPALAARLGGVLLPCLALIAGGCGGPDPAPAPAETTTPTPPPPPPPAAPPTLAWTLTDACADGRGLQVRFFDVNNLLVWPDASHVYVIAAGSSGTYRLSCAAGAKVCFGAATNPDDGGYWGVGLLAEHGCPDCCYACQGQTVNLNLTCG